jgi:hypothetical protein
MLAVLTAVQLALTDSENMKAAIFGVERITRLLVRCEAYERYYMQPDPKPSNYTSLADILTQLYTAVLVFLASSKRVFDCNPISMFAENLMSPRVMISLTLCLRSGWLWIV